MNASSGGSVIIGKNKVGSEQEQRSRRKRMVTGLFFITGRTEAPSPLAAQTYSATRSGQVEFISLWRAYLKLMIDPNRAFSEFQF